MAATPTPRLSELHAMRDQLQTRYAALKAAGLTLNMARGKPASDQLDLPAELMSLPGGADFTAKDGTDCRNYGGLQGLAEARQLFTGVLGVPADQIIIGDNSSLALMHDCVAFGLLKGTCDSQGPWVASQTTFLCPVPGYDRHFAICEEFGIKMINVPLKEDGPDMDVVEKLVASDPTIKGMWCVPKYSNPTGTVYSDQVIERLAAMKTAAPDFRLFWDNAYAVHHLDGKAAEIANIIERCAQHGHPNRAYVFSSTSKITLAGAGLAVFGSSPANVKWLLARMNQRTIGSDKINQLRHVRFLKDEAGLAALMDRHAAILKPKFDKVIEIFQRELGEWGIAHWTLPQGGYFISLDVPAGLAKRVVQLAKEAGIVLTPAGATFPYNKDPEDRNIRIAPSFPDLEEISQAAEGVALCVLLAAAESA
ncbi:DNA-binding transcriptional MocR family regulator [Chitinivorax tropicus]|uniref:DNA-binding transcriptional MocR family regulator n=1 Tax=Chitinivorax tropicus TaxID=714531 RepID=A0A840MKV7_9PROT|nr:aminotransferase class I/II-fold pyridoxal phosphate-dependent enzyme [Chitinivorax tropicus]MBB5017342.1 DNA-binding transcriptional MocR family regulator [Chitinivorax tropicus]